jgi:5'-methylthioinosine phosphorylase
MLGIIGGSGLNRIAELETPRRVAMATPYGEPSAALTVGILQGTEVVFLARHGDGHTIAPHRINYRANIQALHAQGVREIIAVATVGGIRDGLDPGALVVPDQIIDYTHGREATFFDGVAQPLQHIDFTRPFHGALRSRLLHAGMASGEVLHDGGVYGATQGPRLETAAEIDRMARDGADVVGMTGMPEAVLARELGLDYAMLCVVVNAAAGRGGNADGVALAEITAVAEAAMRRVSIILAVLVRQHGR